jgi:hypothetical protein
MNNNVQIRLAQQNDLQSILCLNKKYLFDNIDTTALKKGFIRVSYDAAEMNSIIEHKEVVVAEIGGKIVAYYLLGHRSNAESLNYQYMALTFGGDTLLKNLNIACGAQAIVDEKYRGLGLTGKMLAVLIQNVKNKYDYLFSSITKINQNAYKVHEKSGYIVVGEDETKVYVLLKIN